MPNVLKYRIHVQYFHMKIFCWSGNERVLDESADDNALRIIPPPTTPIMRVQLSSQPISGKQKARTTNQKLKS